jgi:hypothetical protein
VPGAGVLGDCVGVLGVVVGVDVGLGVGLGVALVVDGEGSADGDPLHAVSATARAAVITSLRTPRA